MAPYVSPFSFAEQDASKVNGILKLDDPIAFQLPEHGEGLYRTGRLELDDCANLDLVLYNTPATSTFIYLHQTPVNEQLLQIAGLDMGEFQGLEMMSLPGQLCLGAGRSKLIGQAMEQIIASPVFTSTFESYHQHQLAVFPIAREGLKYQVAEAIFSATGNYCDEIILDAHHVFDSSVPIYNRKVEMTLFKDKDLDKAQKENIGVAFIADSIASGLVMKEVIERVKERFDQIRQVEVIAPLATVRGLSRVARSSCIQDIHVRCHVFETLLNALPPDYYYSAHFDVPEFHIRPELEEQYRAWWGQDADGKAIADTACAGYGWSEVFYSPRKQIEMINGQLTDRHQLKISDLIRRNHVKG